MEGFDEKGYNSNIDIFQETKKMYYFVLYYNHKMKKFYIYNNYIGFNYTYKIEFSSCLDLLDVMTSFDMDFNKAILNLNNYVHNINIFQLRKTTKYNTITSNISTVIVKTFYKKIIIYKYIDLFPNAQIIIFFLLVLNPRNKLITKIMDILQYHEFPTKFIYMNQKLKKITYTFYPYIHYTYYNTMCVLRSISIHTI